MRVRLNRPLPGEAVYPPQLRYSGWQRAECALYAVGTMAVSAVAWHGGQLPTPVGAGLGVLAVLAGRLWLAYLSPPVFVEDDDGHS